MTVFHGGLLRHVDGLRNRAGDERLYRGHHAHVAHVMNRPLAVLRAEAAIEDRQMLVLQRRRAFNRSRGTKFKCDARSSGINRLTFSAVLI